MDKHHPASLLPIWHTPESSMRLLMALINSLAVACASGLILLVPIGNAHVTLIALVVHLVSGVLTLVFFVPYLFTHLRNVREPLRSLLMPWRLRSNRVFRHETRHHRLIGYGLALFYLGLSISGVVISAPAIAFLSGKPAILPLGMSAILLLIHQCLTALFFVFLGLHIWKRVKS